MRATISGPAAALAAALLASCSLGDMTRGKELAQKEVEVFHAVFNQARFETIYDGSHGQLKVGTSREEFLQLLSAVHRKLGKVTGTESQGWNLASSGLQTRVRLIQATTFERGKGTETFQWIVQGGKALLAGYSISSTDLILK